MLSIWWDRLLGTLPPNSTIDAKLYCQQLKNLKTALQVNRQERQKVRSLHDNTRARTEKVKRQKLEELG